MNFTPVIKDRYVINAGVFYLLGIMVVVPFQFYINSLDFWMYKFKPPPPPPGPRPYALNENPPTQTSFIVESNYFSSSLNNDTDVTVPKERTPIQINFTAGFNITFKICLLGALLICSFCTKKLPPPEKRLKWSLCALCIIFGINTAVLEVNSQPMIPWFFAGSLVFATIMNFCTGIAMASLYELISKFPPTYYASIQSGHNVCGILSALIQIIIRAAKLPPRHNGPVYFACGTVILIITTIYYCYTIKHAKCFIYRIRGSNNDNFQRVHFSEPRTSETVKKIKWYYATLIFCEGTTHMVYPGLAALVVPYSHNANEAWKEIFFVPVFTFLGFQVCNLIGRETARIIKIPKHGIILFIPAVLRIVFVPLLIFCNALPRKHLPVYFQDNEFICIIAIFAFSEGILVNLAIVAIATVLEKQEREAIMVLVPLVSSVTVTLSSGLNVFLNTLL